ncbi:N-acetylmuramoyl-L-alanine amidase [Proteinivorax hydrogeniformans]|uniref:N-acetylmuramoyl-L-alanine amidase n=1 Tax=Proteinivorax hydrogeniformans TaxID=1826727 RepID=A0AAU8HWT8_9FIRM
MAQKLFNQPKKRSIKPKLIFLSLLFIVAALITGSSMFFSTSEPSLPQPHVFSSDRANHFVGFKATNDSDNNRVLAFKFANLDNEKVQVHNNDGKLMLTITDTYHTEDFSEKTHLSDVVTVNQNASNTIQFALPLERLGPYNTRISEDGIFITKLNWGLEGKNIVIDPGHGQPDGGAIGPSGLLEKDVVLNISLRLKEILEDKGANVLLTREGDSRPYPSSYLQDLWERVYIAEEFGAHVVLSIHNNASDYPYVGGIETFYRPNTLQGHNNKKFAKTIQNQLTNDLGRRDRGVHSANFNVLRSEEFIGALVELMFITNPEEERLLSDPQMIEKIAQSLAEGIENFFTN